MTATVLCEWIISMVEKKHGSVPRNLSRVLRWLLEFLGNLGVSLTEATTDDFRRFCNHRRSLGRSEGTIVQMVWVLDVIDRVLVDAGLIDQNRAKQLKRPKVVRPSPFGMDLGLVNAVIEYQQQNEVIPAAPCFAMTTKIRLMAILHLSADVGAWSSEIAAIRIRDFSRLDRGEVLIGRETSRERTRYPSLPGQTALCAFMVHRLRSASSLDEHAFVSTYTPYRPLSASAISLILKRAISTAGHRNSSLNPADFQRSMAAHIVEAGFGWQNATEALGYKCIPREATKPPLPMDISRLIADRHPLG
jgi:site-specific recombinase XerD